MASTLLRDDEPQDQVRNHARQSAGQGEDEEDQTKPKGTQAKECSQSPANAADPSILAAQDSFVFSSQIVHPRREYGEGLSLVHARMGQRLRDPSPTRSGIAAAGTTRLLLDELYLVYPTGLMEWEHKGIRFTISFQEMGPLMMASAVAPAEGMYLRVRPFSAIGRDRDSAVEMLKDQIRLEYRRVPDLNGS